MSSNSFVGLPVYRAAGQLFDFAPFEMARSVAFPVVTMTLSADFVDPLLLVLLFVFLVLLGFLLFLLLVAARFEVILVGNRFVSPLRFVNSFDTAIGSGEQRSVDRWLCCDCSLTSLSGFRFGVDFPRSDDLDSGLFLRFASDVVMDDAIWRKISFGGGLGGVKNSLVMIRPECAESSSR